MSQSKNYIILSPSDGTFERAVQLMDRVEDKLRPPSSFYLSALPKRETLEAIKSHFKSVSDAFIAKHGTGLHQVVLDLATDVNKASSVTRAKDNFILPGPCSNPEPKSGKKIPEEVHQNRRDCVDLSFWYTQACGLPGTFPSKGERLNGFTTLYQATKPFYDWYSETLVTPMKVSHPCPQCGTEVEVTLVTNPDYDKIRFECGRCSHKNDPSDCACTKCCEHRESFRVFFIKELITVRDLLAKDFIEQLNKVGIYPPERLSHKQMFRDYTLENTHAMDNTLAREIFALKPENLEDLQSCIRATAETRTQRMFGKKYAHTTNRKIEKNVAQIIKQATDHFFMTKVLYREILPLDIGEVNKHGTDTANEGLRNFLNLSCWGGKHKHDTSRSIETKIGDLEYILKPADSLLSSSLAETEHHRYKTTRVKLCGSTVVEEATWFITWHLEIDKHRTDKGCLDTGVNLKTKIIANPHYFPDAGEFQAIKEQDENGNVPKPKVKAIKKLFRSNAEISRHAVLIAKHPKCHVIPNMRLADVVDLKKLPEGEFTTEDKTYLRSCYLDFSIYDGQGELHFIEELQRGDHHNDPDWAAKDALKKRALDALGAKIEESF